nr:MAG TPA: hypothetical protein [Caudoviricetes sp.]
MYSPERIMYSPEMREYLKEIKRYLVWRYGIFRDGVKSRQAPEALHGRVSASVRGERKACPCLRHKLFQVVFSSYK